MNKLLTAMQAAQTNGVDNPILRYDNLKFSLAKEHSRNPGYIYITNSSYKYLGKISPAGNITARSLDAAQHTPIEALLANPELALTSEGKETGTCCCCGRTLTNPLSIELGIGPICRGSWFPETKEVGNPGLVITQNEIDELMQDRYPDPDPEPTMAEGNVTALDMGAEPELITDRDTLDLAEVIQGYQGLSGEQKLEFFAYIVITGE